jgi:hypothetical protein
MMRSTGRERFEGRRDSCRGRGLNPGPLTSEMSLSFIFTPPLLKANAAF